MTRAAILLMTIGIVTGIPREGNTIQRLCYEGADITRWKSALGYEFRKSMHSIEDLPLAAAPASTSDSDHCQDHTNCTRHIDRVGDMIVMPRSMCTYYRSVPGEEARMREGMIAGNVKEGDYRKYVASALRGKRGSYRHGLSSFRVNSSIRAVIVPGPNLEPNCIGIPQYILDQIKVVDISDPSNIRVRPAVGGDYMMVIRPPCLASGSAQPMRIMSLEFSDIEQMNPIAMSESGLRTALQFPLESCRPYDADFDGDEVQGNIVTSPGSIAECKAFQGAAVRSFSRRKMVDAHRMKHRCTAEKCLSHGMMSSTVTLDTDMSNVGYDVLATGLRPKHMSAFIEALDNIDDGNSYYERCVQTSNTKTMKVSMQSASGYIGRRARVAASMMHMSSLGTPAIAEVCNDDSADEHMVVVTAGRAMTGYYGNPAIRGVSKLTAGIMQEMLTVKTATGVSMTRTSPDVSDAKVSPVVDLLMGCNNTMVMLHGGSLRVLRG